MYTKQVALAVDLTCSGIQEGGQGFGEAVVQMIPDSIEP